MANKTEDKMMICLGPAHHFRETAERIDALLARVAEALDSAKGRKLSGAMRDLAIARGAFVPILKGFRGELPEPPKPKRPPLSPARQKSVEAMARVLLEGAADDESAPTTH